MTPSRKRSRKEPRSGTEDQSRRKRSRRHESGTQRSSVSRRSVHTAKSLARKVLSPLIGCQCGTEDETAPMVNCDACHRWLHMHCVGIADPEELGSQWFCDQCCQQAAQRLSPLSSVAPTSVLSTSDVASQEYMREPVFVQSSESPSLHRGAGLSAALALAPSPASFSNADSNSARRHGGRARAERIGWQMSDPGSPLDRKSTIGSKRYAPPSTPSRHDGGAYDMGDSMTTPSFFAGFPRAEWDSHSRHVRNTTPSPRFGVGLSTPSRHAHSGRGGFSDDEDARNPDDVFSTPSRHVSGSFLGHRAPPSAQTPSRSTQRHHRRESSQNWGLPGAFSTPSRDFLGGAFSTEHSTACSGGLPSLVFSSGGLEAGDSHDHHSSRLWQLQSPTSSTRAARARQVSGQSIGGLPSSALLRTPELQPRTTATTSSIRATRRTSDGYDDQDPPTSSSPFPRTPTFSETAVIRRSPRIASSDRSSLGMGMGMNMGLGMGVPSSSRRLAKLSSSNDHDSTTMGESSDFEGGAGGRAHGNGSGRLSSGALIDLMRSSERPGTGNAVSATKHRQVSSDMPLGLGIGLDIDDVLNWH